ncbi:MAG: MazG family protein [Chlamydiia bacterium]|nr:MazG family protein [Chlamydiia bacterium]
MKESINKGALEEFKALLEVAEILMGPGGCPWDREQTLISLRGSVLEEACEVIEAIDLSDDINLAEELGDLLYQVVFLSMVAENENRFSLGVVIQLIREKLIHRHPHVFKQKTNQSADEVLEQWEVIKKKEKTDRTSILDGIPKGLPSLAKGYKIAKKLQKSGFREEEEEQCPLFETEEDLGNLLWQIAKKSYLSGLNPESALAKKLSKKEASFRLFEKNSTEKMT